ncbi:MAG: alanine dehydrogenase [Ignavibacteriales bacterium]
MKIGIPKEIRFEEKRVALAPAGVDSLIRSGHQVFIEKGAGEGSHFSDDDYTNLGAVLVFGPDEVYQRSDLVVKIHRVTEKETELMKENQILFSFLHLAVGEKKIINTFLEKKITAIGYELIENKAGLPVLYSMSEIAGKLAIQVAENLLESNNQNGRGILIGGITGVAPAAVVILGAGVVGTNAAKSALGRGASVIVLDTDIERLKNIDTTFDKKITTVVANPYTISRGVKFADVLVGAVLKKGEKTPHLVTEEMVKQMKKGAVIVDVAIDQGGVIETSRPTTLSNPTYILHDVTHYCVPNMPAMVARTASYGLTNAAMPYILSIADKGLNHSLIDDPGLIAGACTYNGYCSNEIVADIFNLEYRRIHLFSQN